MDPVAIERIVKRTKEALDLYGLPREWLESTDYFTAPASSHWHGAYKGGLVVHSYQVYKQLEHLTNKLCLNWSRGKSPAVIGLLHDVCKIDLYEQQPDGSYECREHGRDHGLLSLRMLKEHMGLTPEETMCIKYHMGEFTNDLDDHDKTYTQAIHECPNVLWTHTADMYCSQVLEV